MSKSDSSRGGIGFCGLLALVLITLRLIGKLAWSWWWVLAPLWIPLLIFAGVVLVGVAVYAAMDD